MKIIYILLLCAFFTVPKADTKYLGDLSANPYDPNSTSNPYGRYGSKYSPDSINNPYGDYGSRYSDKSANNPYATHAPVIINNGYGAPKLYDYDE